VLRRVPEDDLFAEFVRARRGHLVATARLLTAGDVHQAEDLVQTALLNVYLRWSKVQTNPAAYARRAVVNCFIDHQRKPAMRREQLTDEPPDLRAPPDPADLDPGLVAALADLSPRMRAAVVLRHVQDLSVAEVAEILDCDPGTVKSQTARGLDKLRARLSVSPPTSTTPSSTESGARS